MASAPTRPQLKERFERRRNEVLDRCAAVFAERGYGGAAIEDLCAATELTAGGLYHYIGSKEEALFGIFSRLMDPLLERAERIESGAGDAAGARANGAARPAAERLRELLRLWVGHVADHRDHMLVFNQERHILERDRRRWREIRRSRREFEEVLDRLLAAAAAEADAADADLPLLRFALLGMVNHTAQWLRPGGRLRPEEIADGYWALAMSGLKSGGSAHPDH